MPLKFGAFAMLLAALIVLSGCGGCSCRRAPQPKTAEELEKQLAERQAQLEKPKPDLELNAFASQPSQPRLEGSPEIGPSIFYKPGHWTTATLAAKANNFDIRGELDVTVLDQRGDPIGLPGTPYTVSATRTVDLAKGQPKELESIVFFPNIDGIARLSAEIRPRRGGGGGLERPYILSRMPFYQHHFVVLARYPDAYMYLHGLDSIRNRSELSVSDGVRSGAYYRVELLAHGGRPALPSHSLHWTTIACVLWDDAEPGALSLEQQVAMLDWLHWGGQLILSGPTTLDTLRNSFLADYLPAKATGTRPLAAADFDEINHTWTLGVHGQLGRPLGPLRQWTGVALQKHPEARYVPQTGQLLLERRVGRGRIVVSAFPLSGRELTSWPGFDGFFNACLLRRPRRRFVAGGAEMLGQMEVTWLDDGRPGNGASPDPYDARLVSDLRYFSRDTAPKTVIRPAGSPLTAIEDFSPRPVAGPDVASWDDFSGVARAARQALQNAARIEIPERTFVIWVVCAYLVVLVPVNWLVFRVIGRVEWAWAAAPVIAVACTGVVIRLAQLDIGFARSMTEIAVVELQGDYPRAHVTRYDALYTSLSTRYDIHFDDPGAQVLPFPAGDDPKETGLLLDQSRTELSYRYINDMTLVNLRVESNSTQMIHSEQMVELGGSLVYQDGLGGQRIINRSGSTLHGAGVIRITDAGRVETAWIGTMEPEAMVRLSGRWQPWSPKMDIRPWAESRDRAPLTATSGPMGSLSLHRLMALAEDAGQMQPGDVRLVGWLDQPLPGLEMRPAAPQSRSAAVVIAHLRHGYGPDPRPDANTRAEAANEPPKTISAEEEPWNEND